MSENQEIIVAIEALSRAYSLGNEKLEVLKDITVLIPRGKFVAVCGPSGSGKTTLLNIIGALDKPTSGKLFVAGEDLLDKNENFLSDFRCLNIGFVFQSYNLISTLTVAENIAFPMEWMERPDAEIDARVTQLLETIGLTNRANHFASQLSGGEQQRVAFLGHWQMIRRLFLADEPTGNLDSKNGQKIIQVLKFLKTQGKTVIVSTHDPLIRELADIVLQLEDGKLASPQ